MKFSGLIQFEGRWVRVRDPVRVITAISPEELIPALEEIETAVNKENLYAVGFMTYEASAALDLSTHEKGVLPLIAFGLFEKLQDWDWAENSALVDSHTSFGRQNWQPNLSQSQYRANIRSIKSQMEQGNTYQVNYTFHLRRDFHDDPYHFFQKLAQTQQARYMAYLDIGDFAMCSASPELFFSLDGNIITSKPMKGTAARGRTSAEDDSNIAALNQSEKNRAENIMIVDMIRNDMGQIAETGSVEVSNMFEVERYPTLLQMTSTVTAKTNRSITDIIAAMFPCASITGAPKVRTMQIIHELEAEARGLYTGSIGIIAPHRKAQFNVAIRTVVVDKINHRADFGVGSGIVWDSVAADEFDECRAKASVLTAKLSQYA
jgi:para-aminobenzoate synthetase/4-amino-4-deoxychorismate lyase